MHRRFWLENLKERDHAQNLGADAKIILEWIFWKYVGKLWTGCTWLRVGGRAVERQ
jgi:hypothetical protein